jgi:outer membrane protein
VTRQIRDVVATLIVYVGVLSVAHPTLAADTTPVSLSIADAIRRGEENGEETKIADSVIAEANDQLRVARSAALPGISTQATYLRTIRTPFDLSAFPLPAGVKLPFGQKNTWNGGIDISQPIYTGGAIRAGIAVADESMLSAKARAVETRAKLELDIIEAYYNAVLAERSAGIIAATEEQLDAQLRQVKLLNQAGNASDLEVLRVSVSRENVEPQRVAVMNGRDLALLNLKRLVNIDSRTEIKLTDGLSQRAYRLLSRDEVEELVSRAVERRAVIEAARQGVAILEQQVRLAQATQRPNVAASLHLGQQVFPGQVLPVTGGLKDDWSASLVLQMPLFDGGRRAAQIAAAREQLIQAKLQLEQLREGVQLEVIRERGELERAASLIEARTRTAQQAEKVYELTNTSYQQGYATNLLLDSARFSLQQARANEAQAVYDYLLALARLQYSAGAPIALPPTIASGDTIGHDTVRDHTAKPAVQGEM